MTLASLHRFRLFFFDKHNIIVINNKLKQEMQKQTHKDNYQEPGQINKNEEHQE